MRFLIIILCSLSLTACVSQDQMDVKMSKGCAAGVNTLLDERGNDKKIKEIKTTNYSNEQAEGGLHRRVTFEAIEEDGWLELDKTYSCLFMQEWGIFKSSHKALLVQVKIDDQLYGKKDGTILGGFEDFLKLTRAVDDAMAQ